MDPKQEAKSKDKKEVKLKETTSVKNFFEKNRNQNKHNHTNVALDFDKIADMGRTFLK